MQVQRGNGKIHTVSDTHDDRFMATPACGGNRGAEGYRKVSGAVTCRNCLVILAKAQTEETETMTERNDAATVEQVQANIERAASLVEAENTDGLTELNKETENLISSLPSRGKHGDETFAGMKKRLRGEFRAAAVAQPKPEPKAKAKPAEVAVKDYTAYEGVSELVAMGAEKAAEGVRLHIKTSTTAKDIASIILDMWRRIPNKDGFPDITGTSDPAKKASSAMYKAVGESLGGEDAYDVEQAVKKLIRSVQTQRTDVRAEYLRGLDGDDADAQEERKHYAKLLEGKGDDVPVSEYLANVYGVGLKGEIEKARERYQAKALEAPKGEDSESDQDDESGEAEPVSPDDEIRAVVRKLRADIRKAKPETFEAASDDAKEEVRSELETLYKAIKDMITATL